MESGEENYEVNGMKYDNLIEDINDRKTRQNAGEILFISCVCFLGIIGNMAAFLYYVRILQQSMWTKLMAILSCNDLCASIVYLGTISFNVHTINYPYIGLCQCITAIGHGLSMASLLLLLLITIDRYLQVCHFKRLIWRNATFVIIGIYCYSFGSVSRIFLTIGRKPMNVTEGNITLKANVCAVIKEKYSGVFIIMRSLDISLVFLFIFCSAGFYFKMYRRLRTVSKRVQLYSMSSVASTSTTSLANVNQLKSENVNDVSNITIQANDLADLKAKQADKYRSVQTKLAKMMFYVTLMSLLSFVPYFLILFTTKDGKPYDGPSWKKVLFRTYMLNTSVNPYIVGYFNKEFRAFIKNTTCGFCKRNV